MNALQRFPLAGTRTSAIARWPQEPATASFDTSSLRKADRPRAIDRYIDYFGAPGPGHRFDLSSRSEAAGN